MNGVTPADPSRDPCMLPRQRLNLVFGGIALLLVVSLSINLVLAMALHESFAKLQYSRVFPLGIAGANRPPIGNPATGRSISFWGDSRSSMWDKAALGRDWLVHDFAHGGMTSSQLVLQLQTQTLVRGQFTVVQVGINDLHPLGVLVAQKQEVIERLRRNILLVRDALLARYDVVVLTTLFPPAHVPLVRRLAWDSDTLQYVRDFNEAVRQAADGERVLLFDAHALLSEPDGYLSPRYVDEDFFLHVNRAAYARLNDQLRRLVEQHSLVRN